MVDGLSHTTVVGSVAQEERRRAEVSSKCRRNKTLQLALGRRGLRSRGFGAARTCDEEIWTCGERVGCIRVFIRAVKMECYADPVRGLTMEAVVRSPLAHEENDYGE